MRIIFALFALAILAGCASTPQQPKQVYTYDDIPAHMQGDWVGYAMSLDGREEFGFLVNLRRGYITHIYNLTHECAGRIKYQRTEDNEFHVYLEQMDVNPKERCDRNSYIKVGTADSNDALIYTRHNMQGKAVAHGLLTRKVN